MTTMAAMFGAMPLAFGFGKGGDLRQPLGISIVGGLLVSQLLTLYTTPVIYLYLDRFRLSAQRRWRICHPRVAFERPPQPCEVTRADRKRRHLGGDASSRRQNPLPHC